MCNGAEKDIGFFKSRDGIFKLIQFIISLVLLIVLSSTQYWEVAGLGAIAFTNFVASFCCITLLISAFIYYCQLYRACLLNKLDWKKTEFIYSLGCAILAFIGIILTGIITGQYSYTTLYGSFAASTVLCVFLMFAYLAYSFLLFRGNEPRSVKIPAGAA